MIYKQLYNKIKPAMEDTSAVGMVVRLSYIFNQMMSSLEKSFFTEHFCKMPKEYHDLCKMCDSLIEVVKLVESGERASAYQALYNLYFSEGNRKRLNLCEVNEETAFYRMRSADNYTQYTKNSEDEMYHIPFNLRHLVDNERYSITGFPTFYLSASVYGCWEECQRCNLDFSNVALFKSTSELTFWDMVPPNEKKLVTYENLLGLPLILASRLKVIHKDGRFVPEYIIPQLAMECLIAARKETVDGNLVGIRYESIHLDERDLIFDKFYREDLFYNFAIPPFESNHAGVCSKVKSLFEFWANTSWAEIQYKNPAASISLSEKENDRYFASRFGILEKWLGRLAPGMLTYRTKTKNGVVPGMLTY